MPPVGGYGRRGHVLPGPRPVFYPHENGGFNGDNGARRRRLTGDKVLGSRPSGRESRRSWWRRSGPVARASEQELPCKENPLGYSGELLVLQTCAGTGSAFDIAVRDHMTLFADHRRMHGSAAPSMKDASRRSLGIGKVPVSPLPERVERRVEF